MSACTKTITAPVPENNNDTKKSLNEAKACVCQSATIPTAVPVDCYSWGQTPWVGDNSTANYRAFQGWFQAVTLYPDAEPDNNALIEMDFVMLIEVNRSTGIETMIDFMNYETNAPATLNKNQGGLFSRWYKDNTFSELSNAIIDQGKLQIRPALHPDLISHWWMNEKGKYVRKADCDYYLKCRFRISGAIAMQIAGDYYKEVNSSYPDNTEAFHSAWYGDTKGEYVTACWPPR
jgi:hypothetical protein